MAKWGEELKNNGEFDPRQMKKQVGYQMRQMFSGKTPEEKNFKPNKEKKDGSFKSANKAIVISKPKEALVGRCHFLECKQKDLRARIPCHFPPVKRRALRSCQVAS